MMQGMSNLNRVYEASTATRIGVRPSKPVPGIVGRFVRRHPIFTVWFVFMVLLVGGVMLSDQIAEWRRPPLQPLSAISLAHNSAAEKKAALNLLAWAKGKWAGQEERDSYNAITSISSTVGSHAWSDGSVSENMPLTTIGVRAGSSAQDIAYVCSDAEYFRLGLITVTDPNGEILMDNMHEKINVLERGDCAPPAKWAKLR
jgi:hypothetical protein